MNPTKDLPHFPPLTSEREPTYERGYWREELTLAFRNRGMPLEALRYSTTPTGLHFLLTHFDIPAGDVVSWRLEVGGLVERPLTLRVADLEARPRVTRRVTMECAGNGRGLLHPRPLSQPWLQEAIGTAEWTGTPLAGILEEASSRPGAIDVVFTGADAGMEANQVQRYQRSMKLGEALRDDILLAYQMNGEDLPPQHGGPVRLIVPGWYGMASVKWLVSINVTDRPFDGHYMVGTYRYSKLKGELGEPVTHQRVRALMIPPGIPDFFTRTRLVEAGLVKLEGRAWAGRRGVGRVEISTDAGKSFADARLEPPNDPCCWQAWSFDWDARPGRTTLIVRGTDSEGEAQPLETFWTYRGLGNNVAQRVEVVVG
jgi:sulfane dehydrogenase subunit SoxC